MWIVLCCPLLFLFDDRSITYLKAIFVCFGIDFVRFFCSVSMIIKRTSKEQRYTGPYYYKFIGWRQFFSIKRLKQTVVDFFSTSKYSKKLQGTDVMVGVTSLFLLIQRQMQLFWFALVKLGKKVSRSTPRPKQTFIGSP